MSIPLIDLNAYQENGYFIVKNLLTSGEVKQLRDICLKFCKKRGLRDHGGIAVPDFLNIKEFESIKWINTHSGILGNLRLLLGDNFCFCSHNDISLNRINYEWHKDILEKRWEHYQKTNLWSQINGEEYKIIKVLIYLQDHTNDDHALKIIPKSHLEPGKHEVSDMEVKNRGQRLHPAPGDVLFFDSRITHKGQDSQDKKDRILLTMSYGRNNLFTYEYEAGINARQAKHKSDFINSKGYGVHGGGKKRKRKK